AFFGFVVLNFLLLYLFNFLKYWVLLPLGLLGLLVWSCYKKITNKDKVAKFFRYILTGEVATFLGLIAFLAEFLMSNFLFEFLKNALEDGKLEDFVKSIISLINLISIGLAFIIAYHYELEKYLKSKTQEKRIPRKVLIFALSTPSNSQSNNQNNNKNSLPPNWEPIKDLLEFHKEKLEKLYVLLSKQVADYQQCFEEKILNPLGLKVNIEYIKDVDVNDEINILNKLNGIVFDINKSGYKEEDISIYISSGTSLVTSILTLYGINDDIQIEYLTQGENSKKEIKALNIKKTDLLPFVKDLTKT
ncbi:MAG: hypothetical protein ACP5JX_07750, partial [Sulfurihydrogenibium sp.]